MQTDISLERLQSSLAAMKPDAVLVVSPFASVGRPSLGCHLLQACAGRRGHRVAVVYGSAVFAALIGEDRYRAIERATFSALIGERLFASVAHGIPDALDLLNASLAPGALPEETRERVRDLAALQGDLRTAQAATERYVEVVSEMLHAVAPPVVGFSTTFHQINPSIAVARRVAELDPAVRIIFGGAHCEGEMADGFLSLGLTVDKVFSGEAEETFPAYLDALRDGGPPSARVLHGEPCQDLDALPPVDFSEYYTQLADLGLHDTAQTSTLPFETSRGCWWGHKHHCTFCGLGGLMAFREKSAARILDDLKQLLSTHPNGQIDMTDNIMPLAYFDSLLPQIPKALGDVTIFYEQKANLTFERIVALRTAGVSVIQPGIESLSTGLLQHMKKGSQARTNVEVLRWSRIMGVTVDWNLLYGFPGDQAEHYADIPALMATMRHLQPPAGPFRVSIDRFSPYFDAPDTFGITNLRPLAVYAAIFPDDADLAAIAYHFEGDFAAASLENPELIEAITTEAERWRAAWAGDEPPCLHLERADDGTYAVRDTRNLSGEGERVHAAITEAQARALFASAADPEGPWHAWALERDLAVRLDGRFVSLVTARPSIVRGFRPRPRRRPLGRLAVLGQQGGP